MLQTNPIEKNKVVSLNSTEVFTVDGMTSCSLTTGSSSYLGVSYSNGDCQVKGLNATDFEQFVDVLVELSDGSTRIYKL